MSGMRPKLPDRFAASSELRESITALKIAFEQTGNFYVMKSLRIQERLLATFDGDEAAYREEELIEAYDMIAELPHAVRTWLKFYRAKELAYE